MFAPSLDASLR